MKKDNNVIDDTGTLYASIWDRFDMKQWEEFSDNHFEKWTPLPVNKGFFKGKVCLDAGCGSGRAVRSLLKLGAKKVYAIDGGKGCVRNTTERNKEYADRLDVRLGSVLELPYPDDTFDFVHCDGVLHHTTNPRKGFSELLRVLKPAGKLVVGLYGCGGFLNFAIYFARIFRNVIPQNIALYICKWFSNNPVNWYAIMDCMYVPIRENYYEHEIKSWLEEALLENIQRMDSLWGPYAYGRWMKGEGYIKFIADKPV